MSAKKTTAAAEKSCPTITKPASEGITTSPQTTSQIVPFKPYYHRHKACANCLSQNADLSQAYRLKCRECGFVWIPDKLEYIDAPTLKEAIIATVTGNFRKRYPNADDAEIAWRCGTEIAWLREICFFSKDQTAAEQYVVNFNIFTRLKTTANV